MLSARLRDVMAGPLLTLFPQQRGSHDVPNWRVGLAVDDLGCFEGVRRADQSGPGGSVGGGRTWLRAARRGEV